MSDSFISQTVMLLHRHPCQEVNSKSLGKHYKWIRKTTPRQTISLIQPKEICDLKLYPKEDYTTCVKKKKKALFLNLKRYQSKSQYSDLLTNYFF